MKALEARTAAIVSDFDESFVERSSRGMAGASGGVGFTLDMRKSHVHFERAFFVQRLAASKIVGECRLSHKYGNW